MKGSGLDMDSGLQNGPQGPTAQMVRDVRRSGWIKGRISPVKQLIRRDIKDKTEAKPLPMQSGVEENLIQSPSIMKAMRIVIYGGYHIISKTRSC